MSTETNYTEFINKKVTVDFRNQTGTIKKYDDKQVLIHYPDLGFSESVNYHLVEVKFSPNQF